MSKLIKCLWGIVIIGTVIFVIQNNILILKNGTGETVFEALEEESESETELQKSNDQIHYAGMVVPQKVTEIKKDEERKIKECYVKKGEEVKAGQKLFAYDSSEDEGKISQAYIDIDKAKSDNELLTKQAEQWEKQKKNAKDETDLLSITTSILTCQNEMKQNEYNIRTLEKEIVSLQERVDNATVISEADGTVVKINDSGSTGDLETANIYMAIIQNGNYRVCGTIKSELLELIYEGMPVIVYSRVNETQTWNGSITDIVSSDSNESDTSIDGDSTSTDYKFFVELENADGVILGQHVYIVKDLEQEYMNNDIDMVENESEGYTRPDHKSVVVNIDKITFSDLKWMKTRTDRKNLPLNIYEVHAGSWKKKTNDADGWYNYRELAKLLVPYLKEHFYNYMEIMPLCEHPTDESWGYQNTGYFAPTSRYGSASDLMAAINYFHNNGIGVILDFVPAHFALDNYGLRKYDGTSLYEYPSNDVGVSEWGSCNFMHSRPE